MINFLSNEDRVKLTATIPKINGRDDDVHDERMLRAIAPFKFLNKSRLIMNLFLINFNFRI